MSKKLGDFFKILWPLSKEKKWYLKSRFACTPMYFEKRKTGIH